MKYKMHLPTEQSRDALKSAEQPENFNESHNTSNNGHKYIPEEHGISFICQNIYHNAPVILKERQVDIIAKRLAEGSIKSAYVANGYDIVGWITDRPDLAAIPETIETVESFDEDIEVIISQCTVSGKLHFDIVHKDEYKTFTESMDTRKILAVSYIENYPDGNEVYSHDDIIVEDENNNERCVFEMHTSRDTTHDQVSVRKVYQTKQKDVPDLSKSPEPGDNISHTPGILHVPHMTNMTTRVEGRHGRFRNKSEIDRNYRRSPVRRPRTTYRRDDTKDRWQSTGHRPYEHIKGNIVLETKPFYKTRYYNTNTYCSDSDAETGVKTPTKEQDNKHLYRDNKKKTNSCSEVDLPRNRYLRKDNITLLRNEGIILKRNEPMANVLFVEENKNKELEHNQTNQDTFDRVGDAETDRNFMSQDKVCTQSVAAPGSRAPPAKSEPDTREADESSIEKAKKKRRRTNKRKRPNKLPKTQLDIFQKHFEVGQMKSFFSKYKTEGLKTMKLLEEIHVGTYSTKYKASYQNEVVVLSAYCDQDISDIAAVDMAHIRSSYFVDCFKDCIRGPGPSLWLMTKFCRLGDLQKMLHRDVMRHVFGEIHAMFITAGVLVGIDYLHRHGIVHGNIKPSKIIFNNEGFPVLTGFLKVHEDPGVEKRDVYTPAYAAPERFRGDRTATVDIFSIGCVAYEIVTGRTPFDGGNLEGTKARILSQNYRPWYDPELISYAGELFVDKCLRKQVCDRFAIGESKRNVCSEEWFSSLEFADLRRQVIQSPILDAIQFLNNKAKLSWEEKVIDYNWGRVLDTTCPDKPTLDV